MVSVPDKERQKLVEYRCIAAVAHFRRCEFERCDESDRWPDGWLCEGDGTRVAAEVVAAFQRPEGENPGDGASWVRAWKKAEQDALALEAATGVRAAFGAHDDQPFVIPLDGTQLIPPREGPTDVVQWVAAAVRQKVDKRYSYSGSVVLIVYCMRSTNRVVTG